MLSRDVGGHGEQERFYKGFRKGGGAPVWNSSAYI